MAATKTWSNADTKPLPNFKPTDIQEEMIRRGFLAPPPPKLTAEQEDILAECKADCKTFIRRFCITYDPRLQGKDPYIPFELYPFQEDYIDWLDERLITQTDGMVEKTRDSGASWGFLDWMLHKWLFTRGFAGGIGSNKLESVDSLGDPKALFVKMRMTLERLPPWMLPAGFALKKHAGLGKLINPANGATIVGEGGDQIGRGGRTACYILDEAGFLERPEIADASLSQTTPVRIYIGTPNGRNAFFKKRARMARFQMFWVDDPRKNKWELTAPDGKIVQRGTGRHIAIPLPNADLPAQEDRDGNSLIYPWYELQRSRDDRNTLSQEVDIGYIGSGNPVFENGCLYSIYENLISLNFSHRLYYEEDGKCEWGGTVSTFKDPIVSHSYLITADVAEGLDDDGKHDWSVAHVYDLHTWEQVCHYRGQPDTHIYGEDLAALGRMYNNALIAVERNGPGLSAINTLLNDCGYHNIYYHQDFDDTGMALTSMKPGWPATQRTRHESVRELQAIIRDMAKGELGFIWYEPNTLDELMSFVNLKGRKTGADSGAFDDEVSAARVAAYLMPSYSRRRPMGSFEPKTYQPKLSGTTKLLHI